MGIGYELIKIIKKSFEPNTPRRIEKQNRTYMINKKEIKEKLQLKGNIKQIIINEETIIITTEEEI
jgi:hypothetical protein